MSLNLSSILIEGGIWFGMYLFIMSFVRKVSKDADKDLDPDKRMELANKLLNARKDGIPNDWIPDFTVVFDRFFGRKHFSLKCFLRSAMVSIIFFGFSIFYSHR